MFEVHGKLTVIERTGRKCRCLCECGNEVVKDWYSVSSGATSSCGCFRASNLRLRSVKPIEIGTEFGRLTVTHYLGKRCKCTCTCGNTVTVASTKLRTGRTQSCGCYQKEQASKSALKIIAAGTTFDRLTVVRQEGEYCHCRCSCGEEVKVETKKLRYGHVRSCGCLRIDQAFCMSQAKVLPSGEAAFNSLYAQYRAQAGTRQLSFDLTPDDFKRLTKQNCYYCGCEPSQVKRSVGAVGGYTYNGIDRLDNSLGYTPDNSVTACWMCNNAKHDRSVADFLAWIKLLADRKNMQHSESSNSSFSKAHKLLYRRYQNTAKAKGLLFKLNESEFSALVTSPCSYCGRQAHRRISKTSPDTYTGIDRNDNSVGYVIGNVSACCWDCNNAKGQGTAQELFELADRVFKVHYGNK